MKLIIEGNQKKVKQIQKELAPRCKADKLHLTEIIEEIEEEKVYKPKMTKK